MANFFIPAWIWRLIIAVTVVAAGLFVYWLYNSFNRRKLSRQSHRFPFKAEGKPAILYFTTPGCVPCKTIQQPALEKLLGHLGEDSLKVFRVDAIEEPELARRWNVLSVPTTFIIDKELQVRFINHGTANFQKLLTQVSNLVHKDQAKGSGTSHQPFSSNI